jgi:hypothetical protein
MKELLSKFECDLATIESPDSCYALFRYTIEICAKAQLENELLRNSGAISREKYIEYADRIQKAKELAIKTHGEWAIKMFEQSETQHTPRTFVSSVYSDIFGIVLKGEE